VFPPTCLDQIRSTGVRSCIAEVQTAVEIIL